MKNNNDNKNKVNRKIKQINKVKSFFKKKKNHIKVRATVICYNRYCGSTLQKKSLN